MDLLSEAIRVTTVLQACFVVGATIAAMIAYRNRPLLTHIALLATSYCLLTIIVMHSLFVEAYSRTGVKAVSVLAAFVLGDIALIKVLTQKRNGKSGEMPTSWWMENITNIVRRELQPIKDRMDRAEGRMDS